MRQRRGFTLLEMLVSVSVFTVIMFMTVGSLLVVNDVLRKTRLLRSSMDNMNIAMESIVKKIRTGREYHCGNGIQTNAGNCSVSGEGRDSIGFQTPDGGLFRYRISESRIEVCEKSPGSVGSNPCRTADEFISVTSPEIRIENLTFWVDGATSATDEQAKVIISIFGISDIPGKDRFDTSFNLQTTISKRVLDTFN